jgi:hypothetical protein
MAIADTSSDLGIVLYLIGVPGATTYVDRRGVLVPAETLTTTYQPMAGTEALKTSIMYQGAATAISLFALINLNAATSINVKVQALYGNDPAIDANWADMQIVKELDGTTANVAAFTANGTYLLQSASGYTVGGLRVLAQAVGAGFTANDYIKVGARAGQ